MISPLLATAIAASFALGGVDVYVAPNGDDSNNGSAQAPFASLAAARDALRNVRAAGVPAGEMTVWIADGDYRLETPLIFSTDDSGTAEAPVVYRAATQGGARLFGGDVLPSSGFAPVSDASVLERLPENARETVQRIDLKAIGITEYGELPDNFEGAVALPELFFNDARMNLSRWPNEGWAEIESVVESGAAPWRNYSSDALGSFICKDDRLYRWTNAPAVWLEGYWCFDWACATIRVGGMKPEQREITLASPHVYGIGSGNKAERRYRAINLLEELDEAGEYFLDRSDGSLYFWPPSPIEGARVVLSRVSEPLIQIKQANHLTLQGFVVEDTQGAGIKVEEGSHVTLAGCTIRNTGQAGVQVVGGMQHRVQSNDVYDTGTGGVEIGGGDRKTLTACGHSVDNNHIHDISRRMRTHAYNLNVSGVGVQMTHNLLEDAPHQGIGVSGNDHLFEYNEVARVGMASDDCGAFYMGRNPSERGNVLRYNYWHHLGSEMSHGSCAVYFDDGTGGQTVQGNVFYKAAGGAFGAVFIHGGHDNAIVNNIFIDCSRAVGASPWPAAYWKQWLDGELWQQRLLTEVDITTPPYPERYPELAGYMQSDALLRMNRSERNIAVRCDNLANGNWDVRDCLTVTEDPGFVDEKAENFQLREDAPILQRLPQFERIPFDKIGLYADAFRKEETIKK
jgi:hypothetical protein